MIIKGPWFCIEEFRTMDALRKGMDSVFSVIYPRILVNRLVGYYAESMWIEERGPFGAPDVTILRFCVEMVHTFNGKQIKLKESECPVFRSQHSDQMWNVVSLQLSEMASRLSDANAETISEKSTEYLHNLVNKLASK